MNEVVAFAKLFRDLPPQTVTEVLNRLRRSAALAKAVTTVVEECPKVGKFHELSVAETKRFLRQPFIEDIVTLADICEVENARALVYLLKSSFVSESNLNPTPLVTGADLIALGFKPGPEFKCILHIVETRQLDGDLTTKEEAIEYVDKNWVRA